MNKIYYIINNVPWNQLFTFQDRVNFTALGYPANIWQLDNNPSAVAWAQSKGAQQITEQQAEQILSETWLCDPVTGQVYHPKLSDYQV